MSGDYSRETFAPHKNYSGVRMQQGRVQLDADWNELVDIVDRRWRAETIDIMGRSVVPASTPGAFAITPTGSGTFTIGIGRMYVDGLLAENHGRGPATWDASLGERRGTQPVPYSNQRYLPAPLPPALAGTAGTTDLVYLDVWQREVTALGDPDIREVALGGPDTTTRLQTVWQVRALPGVGAHACGDAIPAWDAATARSPGRLTVTLEDPPSLPGPCPLPAESLYRGLDNLLYRIEIHRGGTVGGAGGAKFKWCSAPFEAALEGVSAGRDELTVSSTGRDEVLAFHQDDWVEILDDHDDFAERGGHMARVDHVDPARRVLVIQPPLPGSFVVHETRHPRVRRWDQRDGVDAEGLLDVTAGPIAIEHGIQLSFSAEPAGGRLRARDYWVCAARSAKGTIDLLTQAPPRGPIHHYARLALVTWAADPTASTVDPCPDSWPPACGGGGGGCTVTVGDGVDSHGQFTDIQQAINALGGRGGVVCVGRGVYTVHDTIRLHGLRNVVVHGTGPATRVIFDAPAASPFMDVRDSARIRIEGLFVVATRGLAVVALSESAQCAVRDCGLVNLGRPSVITVVDATGPEPAAAVAVGSGCVACRVEGSVLVARTGIEATSGHVRELAIRDSVLVSQHAGVHAADVAGLEVRHCQLRGLSAEALGELAGGMTTGRATIDALQQRVERRLTDPEALATFHDVGVLVGQGQGVTVVDSLVVARVGVAGVLLVDARIEDAQILALVGVVVALGLVVRVLDSDILGVLAGVLHAGVAIDVQCENCTLVGLYGVGFLSLGEALLLLGPLLGLGAGGAAGAGPAAEAGGATAVGGIPPTWRLFDSHRMLIGVFATVGLAAVARIQGSTFLTFLAGVVKSGRVISGDLSITDCTLTLCAQGGILLGRDRHAALGALAALLSPRHVIARNALNVLGAGVVTRARFTSIEDNTIVCPVTAVVVDAADGVVRGNTLGGLAPKARSDAGLIEVGPRTEGVVVASNHLAGGPGHGVLLRGDVRRMDILDNVIEKTRENGVSTADDTVTVRELRIARNRFEACRGGEPEAWPWRAGAVVLAGGGAVTISDNRFLRNGPREPETPGFAVVSLEDVAGAEITSNGFDENTRLHTKGGQVVIHVSAPSGALRICGNTLEGNGGQALRVEEESEDVAGQVMVHDNRFRDGSNLAVMPWIDVEAARLSWQGNVSLLQEPGEAPSIRLRTTQAVVSGNTARRTGQATAMRVECQEPDAGRLVASGNLTTGKLEIVGFQSGGVADPGNLVLP